MNLRVLAMLGLASGLLLSTACDTTGTGNTGGAGGAGGDATSSSSSSSSSSGMAGMGGSGGAACAANCADTTTTPGLMMCADAPMASVDLYNKLSDCVCGAMGACATACANSTCKGMAPDGPCQTCLFDQTAAGCGMELNACTSDN